MIGLIVSWIVTLVILAIGIGLLFLIRKLLSRRAPVIAVAASILLVLISVTVAASFSRIAPVAYWPGLLIVAAFIGTICVQPNPWEVTSILRGLAVTSGTVAVCSAFASDLMITVLALLATGVLLRLFTTPPTVEERRTTEQSSSTGAA